MTSTEALIKAKLRISEPGVWAQRADAYMFGPSRTCAMLAICEQFQGDLDPWGDDDGYLEARNIFQEANGTSNGAYFNDTHTLPEVLEAFDRAIAFSLEQDSPF